MFDQFDVWRFVGGIGLFLFAMVQMEAALKAFAGSPLRRFLKRQTGSAFKSIFVGAVSTALVQSSSLVGLMVLAFVGASILSLTNALGIIFGANLGTTLTGWLVATIGFKLDIGDAALPLIGIGALAMVGLRGRVADAGRLMTAIGLLLMGIALMKEGVVAMRTGIEAADLARMSAWQYLLFGVAFAAIMQSSSAAMVITLTALHSGVIDLPSAAAIAVGADLGTTSTVLIGAVQGAAAKKRVALAHLIFNITTAVVAFSLIDVLLHMVQSTGLSDPLFVLVGFHSLFNFLGILIFLPILKPFAHFLDRQFKLARKHESLFVSETTLTVPDAAIAAIEAETANIIARVAMQNLKAFDPPLPTPKGQLPVVMPPPDDDLSGSSYEDLYRRNKILEGEILSFALKVQTQPLEPGQSARLNQLLHAIRHAVDSAKALRDVRHNLEDFLDSPIVRLNTYLDRFKLVMQDFYRDLYQLPENSESQTALQDYMDLLERARERKREIRDQAYQDIHSGQLDDTEISSLLNVNREILNSSTSLATALQEYNLEKREAVVIDNSLVKI
ncbi:MAG: Na/Pi cotransporter family protein [Woeseiaceae bacterium]